MNENHPGTIDFLTRYLRVVAAPTSDAELAEFFTPDATEIELPNAFAPRGATRTLPEMLAASARGRALFARQEYRLLSALATEERAALEVEWVGTLATPLGARAAGEEIRAQVALFFEFRDGRIRKVRHYDSFPPSGGT